MEQTQYKTKAKNPRPTAIEIKEARQLTAEEKNAKLKEIKIIHNFYKFKKTREGWQMKFKKIEFLKLLKHFVFFVYEIDINNFKLVHINNNLISEVNEKYIIASFFNYIDSIPTLEELTITES